MKVMEDIERLEKRAAAKNYLNIPFSKKEKAKELGVGKKVYLDVPFNKKDEAKKHGARWDSIVKKWYWGGGEENLPKELKAFHPKHLRERQEAEIDALEERMSQESFMSGEPNW